MSKIVEEKRIVGTMIGIYCRHHHGKHCGAGELCEECSELLRYANLRLDNCKYGEHKGTCRRCATHCYSPVMAGKVRQVMRYSGPRILFHSPLAALSHFGLIPKKRS